MLEVRWFQLQILQSCAMIRIVIKERLEMKENMKKGPTHQYSEYNNTDAVNVFMKSLEHPLKLLVEDIRQSILQTDSRITEGIKWNVPSFYCHDWFATFHLRAKIGILVVLHPGAKVRSDIPLSDTIDDESHLLAWRSKDRAIATFISRDDFQNKQEAFENIIKQWLNNHADLIQRSSPASKNQLA